jgi:hypothetical protein
MREVKNCKKCNMVFSTNDGARLCKKCQTKEDEIFRSVRDYLYDNPRTNIYDLSVKFNISVQRIQEYIRNERIEVS